MTAGADNDRTTDRHGTTSPKLLPGGQDLSTWVTLFYDLVFVAAILIFTKAVEHVHPQTGVLWIVGVFAATWWVWFSSTLLMHRFHQSDLIHRLLLLFQMLVIVLMAMEARVSFDHEASLIGFEFGLLLLSIAAMYARAGYGRHAASEAGAARQLAAVNLAAAVICLIGSLTPQPYRLIINLVGIIIVTTGSASVWRSLSLFTTQDEEHFLERMGAFTLIVCGEAFIETALAVSGASIESIDVWSLMFEFVLVFALFSSYFEDVPWAGIHPNRFGGWSGLHLFAQVSIAATAVSATKLIGDHTGEPLPDSEIIRLTIPLVAFYLALSGIDACSRRRPYAPVLKVHAATSVLVLIVGVMAWFIPWVHLAETLPMLDVIAILHLIAIDRVRERTGVVDREELAVRT